MDPNECLRLLIAAIARGDAEQANEHRENLITWISRGGFQPDWGFHNELKRAVLKHCTVTLTPEEYEHHTENYDGYCTTCRTFTVGDCEPDTHDRRCDACGANTLYGTEELVMMGTIVIKEG